MSKSDEWTASCSWFWVRWSVSVLHVTIDPARPGISLRSISFEYSCSIVISENHIHSTVSHWLKTKGLVSHFFSGLDAVEGHLGIIIDGPWISNLNFWILLWSLVESVENLSVSIRVVDGTFGPRLPPMRRIILHQRFDWNATNIHGHHSAANRY